MVQFPADLIGEDSRDVLAGDLQHGGDGLGVAAEDVADLIGHMLVDEHDRDVIPRREAVERLFDLRDGGVCKTNQELKGSTQ